MTPKAFREIALSFPGAVESTHMDHPDFRVAKKIFATLNEDETIGVVLLTPAEQRAFLKRAPNVFEPSKGAWGQRGYTQIHLRRAKVADVREAIRLAWLGRAPKRLITQLSDDS